VVDVVLGDDGPQLRVSVGLDGSTELAVTLLPKMHGDGARAFEGIAPIPALLDELTAGQGERHTRSWAPLGEQELWVTLKPGEDACELTLRHWVGLEEIDFRGQARTLGYPSLQLESRPQQR
jgi:hypothetical protein